MGYITSNQGRPIQGVSQQPAKVRLPGQCTASDNFTPDVVKGLMSRHGTKFLSTLPNASLDPNTKWHHYDRGDGEEYYISIEPVTGEVKAWSLDGTQHIINVEDNTEAGYLATSVPKTALKTVTIGDYTFMVNTNTVVDKDSNNSAFLRPTAYVYVQFMDYSQTVTITTDGQLRASYTAPDGSSPSHLAQVQPSYVAAELLSQISGGVDPILGFLYDNIIKIERVDTSDFTISVTDDANNKNTVAIKNILSDTSLLPALPSSESGYTIEINPPGSNTKSDSKYWLKSGNTDSDHGLWTETIAEATSFGLDDSTMPHVLVRESITSGVATFTLREGEWTDREVGDEELNPDPSFVGTQIKDIGVFQNRLYMTGGESVAMSRSSDFFNFYKASMQVTVGTDPFNVYSDAEDINNLIASTSFDNVLVFFSNHGQFLLDGNVAITSENATLARATSFETSVAVPPIASGDGIFFPFTYGTYTGIREFFTDSTLDTKRARPVTDHVKEYIEGDVTIMKASTGLNIMAVKTDASDNILYVHDWLWQGSDKVQSAWGRFIFNENDIILDFEFRDELLIVLIAREGVNVSVETFTPDSPDDTGLVYSARIDRKQDLTLTYVVDRFEMDDPYPEVDEDTILAVRSTGAYESEIGTPVYLIRDGDKLYAFDSDMNDDNSDVTVVIGTKYTSLFTPTNPVAKDENGGALNLDRLTVGNYFMNYDETGLVTITITDPNGKTRTIERYERVLGGIENLVGFAPLIEGSHKASIRKKSDRFTLTYTTESHRPLIVRDFEYNGNLNRRGRRI